MTSRCRICRNFRWNGSAEHWHLHDVRSVSVCSSPLSVWSRVWGLIWWATSCFQVLGGGWWRSIIKAMAFLRWFPELHIDCIKVGTGLETRLWPGQIWEDDHRNRSIALGSEGKDLSVKREKLSSRPWQWRWLKKEKQHYLYMLLAWGCGKGKRMTYICKGMHALNCLCLGSNLNGLQLEWGKVGWSILLRNFCVASAADQFTW